MGGIGRALAALAIGGAVALAGIGPATAQQVTRPDPCGLVEVRVEGLTVSITDLGLNLGGDFRLFQVVWDHPRAEGMSSTEEVVAAGLQVNVDPRTTVSYTYPAPGTYVVELAIATDDDPCQTFDIDAATPPTGLLYEVTVPAGEVSEEPAPTPTVETPTTTADPNGAAARTGGDTGGSDDDGDLLKRLIAAVVSIINAALALRVWRDPPWRDMSPTRDIGTDPLDPRWDEYETLKTRREEQFRAMMLMIALAFMASFVTTLYPPAFAVTISVAIVATVAALLLLITMPPKPTPPPTRGFGKEDDYPFETPSEELY